MDAIILAAGIGSRLGVDLPKILTRVCGKTILEWQLEALHDFNIRLVVGYRSDLVENHIKQLTNKSLVIIKNNNYATTTVVESALLGCKDNHQCVFVDGDLIFNKGQINVLRNTPEDCVVIKRKHLSEQPVYAVVENDYVVKFTRQKTCFEWGCLCKIHPSLLTGKSGFICDALNPTLPLLACFLNVIEIDTPEDLRRAQQWMKKTK